MTADEEEIAEDVKRLLAAILAELRAIRALMQEFVDDIHSG